MKISKRVKFLPSAIREGLAMGVSKREIIKGCARFLFTDSFRKRNKLFIGTLGTYKEIGKNHGKKL